GRRHLGVRGPSNSTQWWPSVASWGVWAQVAGHVILATRSTTHRGAAVSSQHSPALEQLLSTRAKIGMGASLPPARPVEHAQYDFGGGFPDPASFPYDGIVEATARMMKAEGAQALTYGTPQGYLGLRELVCHKY